MIPFTKIFILLTRKMTKPLSDKTKYYMSNRQDKNTIFKRFFIIFGNKYHILESKIYRD